MSADDSERRRDIEARTFKALPRDPNQKEHKKPRAFLHRPEEDAEASEEARRQATLVDAAKTIKTEDFDLSKLGGQPCVRNALLPGIGGGIGVGALRFMFGGKQYIAEVSRPMLMPISTGSIMAFFNWGSGSFVGISLIAYQYCQRRRQLEKDGIRRAVKVLDAKQAIKDAKDTGKPPSAEVAASAPPAVAQSSPPTSTYFSNKEGVSFWQSFKFW